MLTFQDSVARRPEIVVGPFEDLIVSHEHIVGTRPGHEMRELVADRRSERTWWLERYNRPVRSFRAVTVSGDAPQETPLPDPNPA